MYSRRTFRSIYIGLFLLVGISSSGWAQTAELELEVGYRASNTRYFDLLHTDLEVSFDWAKQYLHGKATLTLTPYFYEQQELLLDAKGMDVLAVELITEGKAKELKYDYDDFQIAIALDKMYSRADTFEVAIQYVAKPNEIEIKGSKAITEDKGLYFINPSSNETDKPQQIWTQGETEASSVWFPTIDSPNERCTQEISITVQDRFNTLSNGLLTSSIKNENGTRTDTWRLDQPHAPYLFMMAIGEYAVIDDKWGDMSLRYHVEPEFKDDAKAIFGNTPEMMTLFSELLDYPFPWPNYDQIVVRDYVSGAMENTTSSIFMEALQVNRRELIDFNWDDIIAHELFHQWFGDLVTCESWSNLTLNEGFASYSEYLWNEHKYGRDLADYNLMVDQEQYIGEANYSPKNLIRYYYEDKEDMFDSHSYNKGASVLHMLRNYLGEEAFFAGLNKYLKDNAYRSVEVADLRLAFEAVCGEDLNWFFDQWFLAAGHPVINVSHEMVKDTLRVTVEQLQYNEDIPIFRLPVFIDVWEGGQPKSYPIVIEEAIEVYDFIVGDTPDLVVFDSERQLLAEVEHVLSEEELVFQMKNDVSLYGRMQAMDSLGSIKNKKRANEVLSLAFEDPFYMIRQSAIEYLMDNEVKVKKYESQVLKMLNDSSSFVRAMTVTYLGLMGGDDYKSNIAEALKDSSYMVAGAALSQFVENEWSLDSKLVAEFSKENNINIILPIGMYLALQNDETSFEWFVNKINKVEDQDLYFFIQVYSEKLINAPEVHRKKATVVFQEIAKNNPNYTARFSGYQALLLLTDIEGVEKSLKDIKDGEKDERLKEIYEQI